MRLGPVITGLLFASSLTAAAATTQPPVTFSRDVLPLLQKSCLGWVRGGGY